MKRKHEERGEGQDQLHMRLLMYQQLRSLTVLVVRTRFEQTVRPRNAKANERSRQGLPEEAMQKANVVEDSWRADKIIVYRVAFRYERDDAKGDDAIFMTQRGYCEASWHVWAWLERPVPCMQRGGQAAFMDRGLGR
jgi:hypothetical protein